ncbi:hypothetical protein ACFVIM_13755 [Streptomyces sp. NPDC057638]|uniref:hypothetical protein n=1 Tax=Streptomyces sp. NPDC057638 TaxID=3346190 RepID=UPI00367E1786
MANTTVWFHSLTESVASLGAAARELAAARQMARVASWHTDPMRLLPVEGSVGVPGRYYVSPHDHAVSQLRDLYSGLESSTTELYENTALAYAYGAAQAVAAIHEGARPTHVELHRRDDRFVPPLTGIPDLREALGAWDGIEELALLRDRLTTRERAAVTAREYAFFADLVDHGCAEALNAHDIADGLGDSAYAYGAAAERALHHLLISARTSAK